MRLGAHGKELRGAFRGTRERVVGALRWLIAALMLGGCHAYQRERFAYLLQHPQEAVTSRWLWIGLAVLAALAISVAFALLRASPPKER